MRQVYRSGMAVHDASVLIVEDEPGLADLFEIWLSSDFDVDTVTNGSAALDALTAVPDVIVLDWRIPDVPGEKILEEVNDRNLDSQVAVVTGMDPGVADIDNSVPTVLRKPVQQDELIGAVHELLENDVE